MPLQVVAGQDPPGVVSPQVATGQGPPGVVSPQVAAGQGPPGVVSLQVAARQGPPGVGCGVLIKNFSSYTPTGSVQNSTSHTK